MEWLLALDLDSVLGLGKARISVDVKAEGRPSVAYLYDTAQVIGHTLVHRVFQWLEMAAPHKGLEGLLEHRRCAEYQECQSRSWQRQVEGCRQQLIVPCHLE